MRPSASQHPPKTPLFSPDFHGFEWLISRNQLERVWSCSVTIQLVLITGTFWFFLIKEKSHWFECVGWHASTITTRGRRWRNLEITKKVQKRQLHQCNDLAGMKTSSFNFCLNLRWLDWIFLGRYLPRLSLNYVGMSKDIEKRSPQLYYIRMKISYDLGFIAIGVAMAT